MNNNINNETCLMNKEIKKNRIYNSLCRKKIVEKINNIIDDNYITDIYNIIIEEIGNNYSVNNNGIFININILSDKCIDKINNYLKNIKDNIYHEDTKFYDNKKYVCDKVDNLLNAGFKLNNKEKTLLKRI